MIHARDDYNRIQDPAIDNESLLSPGSTAIGPCEPVVLFRAQDRHMVAVLEHYASIVRLDQNADPNIVKSVEKHIEVVKNWQKTHPTKSPDL